MRKQFPQYYRVSQSDLLKRFDECVFIFDSCVLLDIFRMKEELVDKMFNVIEHYKDQIRVPYHAASEYYKNINVVLKFQLNKIRESQKSFEAFIKTFQAQRNYPYISPEASDLLDKLKNQIDKDFSEQTLYLEKQLVQGLHQNKLAQLLDGCVLEAFSSTELMEIEKQGETRYANHIPPGWKDASKDENRDGDLINWMEILRYAKQNAKTIIFISNDVKEDWVQKEMGKNIGVQPLLLEEFYEKKGNHNQLFHVYTLDAFLSLVNEHNKNVISVDTVQDVKVSMEQSLDDITMFDNLKLQEITPSYKDMALYFHEIMNKKAECSTASDDLYSIKEVSKMDFTEKTLDHSDEILTQNKSKKNEDCDKDKKTLEEAVGDEEKINEDELHQKSKGDSDIGESDNPKSSNET